MHLIAIAALVFMGSASIVHGAEGTLPPQHERPPFYQHAIERSENVEEHVKERKELFEENKGERLEFREEFKEDRKELYGSSTPEERKEFRHERFGERREMLRDQWEERKALFASSTGEWKANLTDAVKERVENRAEHFADLFSAMLDRLSGIGDRIQGRIDDLSAQGVDVSEAEGLLAVADEELEEAAALADELATAVAEALASTTPREALEELKDDKEAVKVALREAHEALRAAAQALPKNVEEPIN